MSAPSGQRASELAAQQVEQIVTAAQAAAEEIRKEAELERQDIRKAARREGEEELTEARKEAIHLGQDARRDAEALIDDARDEAAQIRDKARRSVEGRTAAAERAAADVLEEARALSSGLHQLGKALEDHADRILRDVQAAHKRMQADLRVGPGADDDDPLRNLARETRPGQSSDGAASRSRSSRRETRQPTGADDNGEAAPRGRRRNPFEEIELPSWVGRES